MYTILNLQYTDNMSTIVRSAILGGVDGAITSFAIVAACDVGNLGTRAAAIVGFASLFADAGSMGCSEYLAVRADAALRQNTALRPVLSGVSCFAAFVVCGLVPLLTYLASTSLLSCASFSVTTLMLLGAVRAGVSSEPLVSTLLETATLGGLAGGIAYGVGLLSHRIST